MRRNRRWQERWEEITEAEIEAAADVMLTPIAAPDPGPKNKWRAMKDEDIIAHQESWRSCCEDDQSGRVGARDRIMERRVAKCSKCPQEFLTERPKFCRRKDCPQRSVARLLGFDPDMLELLGDDFEHSHQGEVLPPGRARGRRQATKK